MKKKEKLIGSVIICILIAIITIIGYGMNSRREAPIDEGIFIEEDDESSADSNDKLASENKTRNIPVEIKGEVIKPDVYIIEEGTIVKELITMAGGLTALGDTSGINQAQTLREGMCIVVPSINSSASVPTAGSVLPTPGVTDIININTATLAELNSLPGIGDVTAQRIIDYREEKGGFKSKEELKNVERIGEGTYNKLKDKIDIR
ncbi:MAG: helix-hairpin-helix domain-containing protein [Clostridiaceae bacterium]